MAEPAKQVGVALHVHASQRWVLSVLFAALLSALVLWTGRTSSLLEIGFVSAFLCVVVQQDVHRTRIPNALTFPAFALALGLAGWSEGWRGLAGGLVGASLVFLLLLLPFATRAIRAGDVKALMVLGALWGPAEALALVCWSTVFGGLIALVLLTLRGGLLEMFGRWKDTVGATLASGRWTYFNAAPGAAARTGLPYGVPIALAVVALQRWGLPWELA